MDNYNYDEFYVQMYDDVNLNFVPSLFMASILFIYLLFLENINYFL